MGDRASTPRKIAVIGGGISGLAAAHRLVELDGQLEVALFEAGDRLGGVLATEQRDGFLIERAADMFTTKDPWAVDLCRRIGFDDQLIGTNEALRRAFVVRRDRLVEVPGGFSLMSPTRMWPIVTTPLLGWSGKLRLAQELLLKGKSDSDDESLASFVRRRFGRQAFERLIQPLIGGIYTADPEKLSMAATMPRFVELERRFGSVARGMRKAARGKPDERSASGARYGMFLAPRAGMSSLVDALARRLPAGCVRTAQPVTNVSRTDGGCWRLAATRDEDFDAVVMATPAPITAKLLDQVDRELAAEIGQIEHAGTIVVASGFRREDIAHRLNGFGFVVPRIERRRILACSFSSVKFDGRAAEGHVLLRTFIGGALQPELLELDDDDVLALVNSELRELLGVRGEPVRQEVFRWPGAMPQYHVGHLGRVARIEQRVAAIGNVEIAGNAYRGVGIPFCIHSGEQAAERILGRDEAGDSRVAVN